MSSFNFDIDIINARTATIQNHAGEKLRLYALTEYTNLINEMESCKGSFKTAICAELDEEKKAVEATADFIIKLLVMMRQTAQAFADTDKSFQQGALAWDVKSSDK